MRWKKKNGNEMVTNDDKATVDYMESIGAECIEGPAAPQDDPPAETVEISEADIPSQGDPEPEAA